MFESREEAAAYLSGMIDGEGSVFLKRSKTGASGHIAIYNSEVALIEACEAALNLLGVNYRINTRKPRAASTILATKTQYILSVGKRSDVSLLASMIRLRHPRKAKNMVQILDHFKTTRAWTTRDHWPVEETRRLLKTMTQREAAEILGVSQSTVQKWASG